MRNTQFYFICKDCLSKYHKWIGYCNVCNKWNSIEKVSNNYIKKENDENIIKFLSLNTKKINIKSRMSTGLSELDRACGGGLVQGAVILIGGDPGIGKSTILLQALTKMSIDYKCCYISGEEGFDQVSMRALRLNIDSKIDFAFITNVNKIIQSLEKKDYNVIVIDSIQTMSIDTETSSPGSVSQIRTSALALISLAKRKNFSLFLVGHVTKEGNIAGPRILEHMVDTVLYFEGERGNHFRILRSVKNRFGPTHEIGIFQMGESGLKQVTNPYFLLNSDDKNPVSGTSIFPALADIGANSRPRLVEIQALVAKSNCSPPKRTAIGWNYGRLNMILAVLENRCAIPLSKCDVYLNVTSGFKIHEPYADLAVVAALISAVYNYPIQRKTVILGEIGLCGEIRQVSQLELRLQEAAQLGFRNAYIPTKERQGTEKTLIKGLNIIECSHIQDLCKLCGQELQEHIVINKKLITDL